MKNPQTPTLPETQRKRRGHRFYPSAAEARQIPALADAYNWASGRGHTIHAHYFVGGCDWWVTNYDPATGMAHGYACLGMPDIAEWGDFSLPELEEVSVRVEIIWPTGPGYLGIPVERDCYWTKVTTEEANLPGTPFWDAVAT